MSDWEIRDYEVTVKRLNGEVARLTAAMQEAYAVLHTTPLMESTPWASRAEKILWAALEADSR